MPFFGKDFDLIRPTDARHVISHYDYYIVGWIYFRSVRLIKYILCIKIVDFLFSIGLIPWIVMDVLNGGRNRHEKLLLKWIGKMRCLLLEQKIVLTEKEN